MTAIADTLRTLREARGLTQRELAQAVGLPRSSLTDMESGRVASPRRDVLDALAATLGVDTLVLLGDAANPLDALAAAIRAYDPAALVEVDESGPAVACWLSTGELCYFWNRHGWAHYLRSQGIEAPDDLPDLINPQRQTPSAAQRDGLLAVMKG
jgi:transcriptional regulator with XRE-family HTH domain